MTDQLSGQAQPAANNSSMADQQFVGERMLSHHGDHSSILDIQKSSHSIEGRPEYVEGVSLLDTL